MFGKKFWKIQEFLEKRLDFSGKSDYSGIENQEFLITTLCRQGIEGSCFLAWAGTWAVRKEEAIPLFIWEGLHHGDFGSGGLRYRRYGFGVTYLQQLAVMEVLEREESLVREVFIAFSVLGAGNRGLYQADLAVS
jgi:hypothetical protein